MGLSTRAKRIGIGLGVGALAIGAGIGARKLFSRSKSGMHRIKRSSVSRLRSRVQKLSLKIKERQLKRKLFKEELRV